LKFNTIEHTADIGIEVEAGTLEELFAGAAQAMFSIMVADDSVLPAVDRRVKLEAADLGELMFRWLNELIYFVSGEGLLMSKFDVTRVEECRLDAVVSGEPIDAARHDLELEIKGATYYELAVERRDGEWYARVIFDV
jgi:SHS2 domain-containing protein